jgi:hypothetical protein
MTPWLKIALFTNLVYWAVFVTLAVRRRPGVAAIVLGVMHMLLAGVVSVAPIRSFVDPDYPGFRIGVLQFEHRAATPVAASILLWALTCAFLLAGRARGRRPVRGEPAPRHPAVRNRRPHPVRRAPDDQRPAGRDPHGDPLRRRTGAQRVVVGTEGGAPDGFVAVLRSPAARRRQGHPKASNG